MWLVLERRRLITISSVLLLIVSHALGQPDSTVSTTYDVAKPASSTASVEPTCESRTVNYITHTLPQQCLTSSPSVYATSESATSSSAPVDPTPTTSDDGSTINHDELDADGNDLSTGAFMSFEEWKAMMLEKSGQEALEPKTRKTKETHGDAYPGDDFDSLGDEGEVSLDFDAYSDKISEITSSTKPSQKDKDNEEQVEKVTYDEGLTQGYRSKDAGKTSKERFSYASFDAGATIKKESPGAKNSRSILVENKDSYMLLECAMEDKFVIVELSDDILVDTIVLANFEFFSSMIRHFRVSVSDRYPVKSEKWKVLGTFEARNSRDIQPFLVENPQIWAKYVRIEFLTHYGNEYYCPVSLLRVHGTRMLDSWKEADPADLEGEDDKAAADGSESVEVVEDQPEEVEVVESPEPNNQLIALKQSNFVPYWDESYFYYNYPCNSTCAPADLDESGSQDSEERDQDPLAAKPQSIGTAEQTVPASSGASSSEASATQPISQTVTESGQPAASSSSGEASASPAIANSTESIPTATSSPDSRSVSTTAASSTTITPPSLAKTATVKPPSKSKTAASTSVKPPSSRSAAPKGQPSGSPTTPRNKTSTTTSSAASSPTVQDSFFKALNKRIQALESNTTLSLQYIESQSLFLREALAKLERRQVAKVDLFLDTLNKTVLSELREVRVQYDQIWQSTVIALESQREQSEREIVALSARLGFLADEVAFQKRMAILQSLLLLGCLVLVIFSSRGGFADSSYYAAQFLGGAPPPSSSSRLASPIFPSTPRAHQHQHHHPGTRDDDPSLLSAADASPQARLRRSPSSQTPDSSLRHQPRRRSRGSETQTQTPDSAIRRRPSPGRSATDPADTGFFRAPTPSSVDVGYDSEPALTPTGDGNGDGGEYYNTDGTRVAGDGHDGGVSSGSSYAETLARKSERQLTPSSEADGIEYVTLSSRPPLTHATSARKPLPALPEDPD